MTAVERNSGIWHTILIGMFSVDVKYTSEINDTTHHQEKNRRPDKVFSQHGN